MLLVGPWDLVVDFAGHLQMLFRQTFRTDSLTISAGIAIVKPRFPIRLAAQQAEDLLYRAKVEQASCATGAKDQCAALGQLWKWRDHDAVVQAGKRLAGWVDAGIINRGWLHTLLELALLRRGETHGRDPTVTPSRAALRLVYHTSRNWPSLNDRDLEKRAARQWVDRVAAEFDRFDAASDANATYLPAILRYAMLATRQADREDTL